MRLFKLIAYALLGYALYEFVRGMTDVPGAQGAGGQASGQGQGGGGSRGGRQGGGGGGGGSRAKSNLTGPQQGVKVPVQGSDGGSGTQVVGRGVVS